MTGLRPGDVALVWFPFSRNEPEPYKKRPVLVLAVKGTPPDQAVWCVMITGNAARFAHPGPGDVVIAEWQSVGLDSPSVIRTRRVWTGEGRDFERRVGAVEPATLEEARTEIADILGMAIEPPS